MIIGDLNVKVQYLYHSGFSVETANNLIIFDYYQGTIHLGNKPVYVFSSHGHPDHYNPVILKWQKERPDIHYIFSNDIEIKPGNNRITFMSPAELCQINDLKIKAYGSTDLGVSYHVSCEGLHIFHAGDLNWWYWWGETAEEIARAEKDFKAEIAKIKGQKIDLAFFPVDPRLEHNYGLGAEYFIEELKPGVLIPMHFWDNQQAVQKFADKMQDSPTKIITLTQRGQIAETVFFV